MGYFDGLTRAINRALRRLRRWWRSLKQSVLGGPPQVGHVYRDRITNDRLKIRSIGVTKITVDRQPAVGAGQDRVDRSILETAVQLGVLEHAPDCPRSDCDV